MSVILLSDASALRTSDEHYAFDLSVGRRLSPVEFRPEAPTRPADPRSTPPPPPQAMAMKETGYAEPVVPASAYLPSSR